MLFFEFELTLLGDDEIDMVIRKVEKEMQLMNRVSFLIISRLRIKSNEICTVQEMP